MKRERFTATRFDALIDIGGSTIQELSLTWDTPITGAREHFDYQKCDIGTCILRRLRERERVDVVLCKLWISHESIFQRLAK